jgi:predicted alpha/beta-fold hydrolase
MPIISPSTYRPPPGMANGHLQTILPSLLRRVKGVSYERERIETADGDFIDLDWARCGSRRLVVLCHGLEGSSQAAYIRGMARAFNRAGWDAVAYNYRGCSGEANRLLRAYHSGATDDLATVHRHLAGRHACRRMGWIGFSLGGNLVLKYLGENGRALDNEQHWAAAISVPCDLAASARRLDRPANRIYTWRFLRTLKAKALEKARRYPGRIDRPKLAAARTLRAFDDLFTAPVHGFRDAEDYWRRCSALNFLDRIQVPTLVINALNDPFLDGLCFPYAAARRNPMLFLETPRSGGHVGFPPRVWNGLFWHEARILRFARQLGAAPPGIELPDAVGLRTPN